MRITEIQNKILENNLLIKGLQSQVAELSRENSRLADQREQKLINHFKDYIQIDSEHQSNTWLNLNGVQIGLKPGETPASSSFRPGDVIKFIKKNAKSIVVQCVTKVNTKNINGVRQDEVTHPNTIFRVPTINLYEVMSRDPQFSQAFKTYVIRKESLELLGL